MARVVVVLRDPDPRTDGAGIARLRAAGIAVAEGVRAAEARALQAGFLSRVGRGRPALTLKLAATLDGRIATAAGESRWITGAEARAHVHAERARHDAVMVGGGTARADDPRLTVRGLGAAHAAGPQPVRVVLARGLDLPPGAALWDAGPALWIVHAADAAPARVAQARARGAETIPCPAGAHGLDLGAAMAALGRRGLTRVYCEGGGALAAGLLRAGLVDRVDAYVAGAAIGAEGVPALGPMGLAALADAPRLRLEGVRRLGPDVLTRWAAP